MTWHHVKQPHIGGPAKKQHHAGTGRREPAATRKKISESLKQYAHEHHPRRGTEHGTSHHKKGSNG